MIHPHAWHFRVAKKPQQRTGLNWDEILCRIRSGRTRTIDYGTNRMGLPFQRESDDRVDWIVVFTFEQAPDGLHQIAVVTDGFVIDRGEHLKDLARIASQTGQRVN